MPSKSDLVDNAAKLFTYLARLQEMREKRISDLESYKEDGKVIWLQSLPHHDAVSVSDVITEYEPVLTVDRVTTAEPQLPPPDIREYLNGPWDDPESRPTVRPNAIEDVQYRAHEWLTVWDFSAKKELSNRPIRKLYADLFQLRRDMERASESFELVFAFGLLTWLPAGSSKVRRHIFTVGIEVGFDDVSGQISVTLTDSHAGIRTELNMLEPSMHDASLPSRLQTLAETNEVLEISAGFSQEIGVPTANLLATNGAYVDTSSIPDAQAYPQVSYSPAIIMRKKGQRGYTTAFDRIAEQIQQSGEVPAGLITMIDPDQPPSTVRDSRPGALLEGKDNEIFSPLPLNREQEMVLERVDTNAQTVVQGPPGTGKTHTAAALITHLLAQGKRILVTAHTERALYEVRGKLPEEIRDLAVSAIGHSTSEMAELNGSIHKIASSSEDFDLQENLALEKQERHKVSKLLSERERMTKKLVDALLDESTSQQVGSYRGTKPALVRRYFDDAEKYRWILHGNGPKTSTSPLQNGEAIELLQLLRDDALTFSVSEFKLTPKDLPTLMPLEEFTEAANHLSQLNKSISLSPSVHWADLAKSISEIPRETIEQLHSDLIRLLHQIEAIESAGIDWRNKVLREVIAGSGDRWISIVRDIDSSTRRAQKILRSCGNVQIEPADGLARYSHQAAELSEYVASGNVIRLKPDGTVKLPLLSRAVLKNNMSLLESVRVDGRVPTSAEDYALLQNHIQFETAITQAESLIAAVRPVPAAQSPHHRISEARQTVELLQPAIDLGVEIVKLNKHVEKLLLRTISWKSPGAVRSYAEALQRRIAELDIKDAKVPFQELSRSLYVALRTQQQYPEWITLLLSAVKSRDTLAYSEALRKRENIVRDIDTVKRRESLSSLLNQWHPVLAKEVIGDPNSLKWDEQLSTLENAADWAHLGVKIQQRGSIDANRIQDEIRVIDEKLHESAGELAQLRAWREAVHRLTPTARARLTHYVQETRRLGKGTGKYASEQRASVRRALDACREYVPVWIMPLGRVVDQVSLNENSFDVIIVDEASQAGMEATFLQYLAPRVVVIGDDKQVSPNTIGTSLLEVDSLASQYLKGIPFKDAFANPNRSFFDDAVMRFSGRITLKEHRRCVPEIINFSNLIAYERENIRLEPVRQVGRDRLDPFKVVYAEGGFTRGTTDSLQNEVEAQAVVDLVAACDKDARYEGMTFGIISLTGKGQARKMQQLVQQRFSPNMIESRELMVGDASDFQGAERDVMFLSMVASLSGERRVAALTRDLYVQRYNVAVSRAKDQVWLVHSLRRSDVHTEGDMRHELLEYAYNVASRSTCQLEASQPVDERSHVEPFDSLFEQRVYNQISARGYSITPQVPVIGYHIDLVVEGVDQRVAVECDGDHWHSGDAIRQDLVRQRNLERVGWTFFRVRESDFYADTAGSLEPLWQLLDDKGIEPFADSSDSGESPSGNFYRVARDGSIEQLSGPGDELTEGLKVISTIPTCALKSADSAL
ncbi:RecBCD enzyme subunit RecD [Corynebacterium atrinae]|uniref:AAA domain-containing protein n=1 Tax=Corynebacterium atrinae TaxID=1336740 RepID=UPI0025B34EDA|nr:AAA domain-containing protein [Corynebacterium atrinae]WJY63668.1 RecBCD enzyme subunit RecD [Corynebacterium atrinae]